MHETGPIKRRPTSLQPWKRRPAPPPPASRRPRPALHCLLQLGSDTTWGPQSAGVRLHPNVLKTLRPAHRSPGSCPRGSTECSVASPRGGQRAAPPLSLRPEGLSSELVAQDRPPHTPSPDLWARPCFPCPALPLWVPAAVSLRPEALPDQGTCPTRRVPWLRAPDAGSVSASLNPTPESTLHCSRSPDVQHNPDATKPGFCLLQARRRGHRYEPAAGAARLQIMLRRSCLPKSAPVSCAKRKTSDSQVSKTEEPLKSHALHRPETMVQTRSPD